MEIGKRIEVLESESKLLRGEIKTTITNIRELLATVLLEPLGAGSTSENGQAQAAAQKVPGFDQDKKDGGVSAAGQKLSENFENRVLETLIAHDAILNHEIAKKDLVLPPKQPPRQAEIDGSGGKDGMPPKPEMMSSPDKKNEEEKPEPKKQSIKKVPVNADDKPVEDPGSPSVASEVNPLVSLIRWVAQAKKDLGKGQLPVFLEIYTIGGTVSSELKEVILRLAEVTDDNFESGETRKSFGKLFGDQLASILEICQASGQLSPEMKQAILRLADLADMREKSSKTEIWSRLILELHGIIDGNERLFVNKKQQLKEENKKSESKSSARQVKLKLVLPTGDGEKEFGLTFQPEDARGEG
jgi:hypothetical protein